MNRCKIHIPFFRKKSNNLQITFDTQNVDPMEALAVLYAVPGCDVTRIKKKAHTITCELTCDNAHMSVLMDLLLAHPYMTALEIHEKH